MSSIVQDLVYAWRGLIKSPGFAVAALLTLSFSIGANTVIFSLVNGVLLRPLNFRNPEELAWIWATRTDRDKAFYSIPNFLDTKAQNRTFEEIAAFANWGANLTGENDSQRLQGIRITVNAFNMLGFEPAAGRLFTTDDDQSNAGHVAVLSYALWQQRFGGAVNAIGRNVILNGDTYEVIGVLPPTFAIPDAEIEIAVPLNVTSDARRTERGSNFLRVFGRVKSNATIMQARSDLASITQRLRDQYPDANSKLTAPNILPLQNEMVGKYKDGLILLLGAVGFVLLIACTNLANLLLSRSTTRQKEMAIRAAIGATRVRLVRQLLAESLLLALLGGAAGFLIALASRRVLLTLAPSDLPRVAEVGLDIRVFLFSLVVSILAGILFGLAPALYSTKPDLNTSLKEGGRDNGQTGKGNHLRKVFVIAELALAFQLLTCAGLLMKSLSRIEGINPGFEAGQVLTMRLSLPAARYKQPGDVRLFYDKLAARLADLHGISEVGAINVLPLSGMNVRTDFSIAGRPPLSPADMPAAQDRWVSADYFRLMRIPLIEGRSFTSDDDERTASVVVIDKTLAQHYWPQQSALGSHLLIDFGDGSKALDSEIIGVVGDVKHFELNDSSTDTLYLPFYQIPPNSVSSFANGLTLVVRNDSNSQSLVGEIKRELQSVDPEVPVSNARSMNYFLTASIASRRFNLTLISVFAAAALALAAIGIYAVISFSVSQRTHEIGIRMSLGANGSDVMKLIMGNSLNLILVGLAVGSLAALTSGRLLSGFLFGVSPIDGFTFIIVALGMFCVAIPGCYFPARRATRIDPLAAVRQA